MTKKIYFCMECKKRIDTVDNVLFIEDVFNRGFCSEECIMNFYRPYIAVFQQEEEALRQTLSLPSLLNEILTLGIDEKEQERYLQDALYSPQEVWLDTSELQEKYYTHILKIEKPHLNASFYLVVICSYFESSPSFIYHKTFSQSEDLVQLYRTGDKVELQLVDDGTGSNKQVSDQEIELSAEIIEQMELKKSQLLAELLAAKDPSDIDFDEFIDYEKFLTSTLENPDEVYERLDDEGELMATFIKSFKEAEHCFYYVAICWKCKLEGLSEQFLIPILSFPSIDNGLYQEYAVGDKTLGQVKN